MPVYIDTLGRYYSNASALSANDLLVNNPSPTLAGIISSTPTVIATINDKLLNAVAKAGDHGKDITVSSASKNRTSFA